jgi:Holliday junction resolvase
MPDCLVALNGKLIMIELKVTKGKKVSLSPHQVSFHAKYAELGAPSFVLVRGPLSLDLFPNTEILALAELGTVAAASFTTPIERPDWQGLAQALLAYEKAPLRAL